LKAIKGERNFLKQNIRRCDASKAIIPWTWSGVRNTPKSSESNSEQMAFPAWGSRKTSEGWFLHVV
jgi:hypothetical protein